MTCQTCGTVNLAGAKFCSECGGRLLAGCPNCGATNLPGAKFCSECGTRLEAAASSGAPRGRPTERSGCGRPAPTTERRLVTVLFADLVGFTSLAADRDSEAVRELLSRYFDAAREVVERYGGTVEKFIGDAVMAVWGAPVAREDDAERAVRAALDLVVAVRTLDSGADGRGLEARAGVLTGEAAVTLGATGQGMVAGDLVNTASRLQSVAPPGHGPRRRGDPASRQLGDRRSSRPGRRSSRARPRRCPPGGPCGSWPSAAAKADRRPRGAVRRPRRRAAPAQGLLPRHVSGAALPPPLGHRPGRDRQEPPRLGVPEVHRRRARDRLVARGPLAGATAKGSRSGPSARWSAGGPAWPRPTTRPRPASGSPRPLLEFVPDETERRWIEPALLALLGFGDASARSRDELFAVVADVLRAGRHRGPGGPGLRGPPLGRPGPARLHRPPPRVVDEQPDLRRSPSPVRSCSNGGRTGVPARRNFVALSLEPLTEVGDAGAARRARARACRTRPSGRSSIGPAGSRCTRSRPSGCSSPKASSSEADGVFRPVGDLGDLAVPETLHALIAARLDALDAGRSGVCSRTRRCWARRSRSSPWPRCAASRARWLEARLRAPGPARGPDPRHRSALARTGPVRLRPGAPPRGRLLHAGSNATAAPATSPPRATSRRSATTQMAGVLADPLPRCLPRLARRRRGERPRRPGPDRAARRRRPGHRARLARPGDRVTSSGP